MRISILREFVGLAQNLNFTTTAKQGFVTQSALSKHISWLERELKAELFLRDRKGVHLTELGEVFYRDISQCLDMYDEALGNLERAKRGVKSLLRIGYLYGATQTFLLNLHKNFATENPSIDPELFSLGHVKVIEMLEDDSIDIGLTAEFDDMDPARYNRHIIYADYCCAVMSRNHRYSNRTYLMLSDLIGETILMDNKNQPGYSFILNQACKAEQVEVEFRYVFNTFDEIITRIETDDAITIFPSHLMQVFGLDSIAFVPLINKYFVHNVSAIWKKSKETDEIRLFIESIKQTIPYRDLYTCISSQLENETNQVLESRKSQGRYPTF